MAQRLSDIPETTAVRLSDIPEDKPDPIAEKLAAVESGKQATADAEPGAGEYLGNRAKKGFAGFMGLPGDIADASRDIPFISGHPAMVPLSLMVNTVVEKLGLKKTREQLPTEKVIATSRTYRDAFGYDPEMKTTNDGLRYAGGVAEMAAAGGPFAPALKATAIPSLIAGSASSGIGLEAGGDVVEGLAEDVDVEGRLVVDGTPYAAGDVVHLR